MGYPRRLRNKFSRPKRLWDEERIAIDSELKRTYGLKNSSEVWRAEEELRKYRREARRLLSLSEEERVADAKKILTKLARLGVMKKGDIEDVLSLSVRDILERRLQTMVYRKGLAKTIKQARQLVTHGFIAVSGKRINSPGYFVSVKEESDITYSKPIDLSAGEMKGDEGKAVKESVAPETPEASEKSPEPPSA
jgi:small subunit ribosomal protein S4